MALYSLAEFITASILYAVSITSSCVLLLMTLLLQYESNLGDWQYLYIDLVLIFALSIVSKSHDCHMM